MRIKWFSWVNVNHLQTDCIALNQERSLIISMDYKFDTVLCDVADVDYFAEHKMKGEETGFKFFVACEWDAIDVYTSQTEALFRRAVGRDSLLVEECECTLSSFQVSSGLVCHQFLGYGRGTGLLFGDRWLASC